MTVSPRAALHSGLQSLRTKCTLRFEILSRALLSAKHSTLSKSFWVRY
jgi:hypothetical protein